MIANRVEKGGYGGGNYDLGAAAALLGGAASGGFPSGAVPSAQTIGFSGGGAFGGNPASRASMVPNAPNVEAGLRSMGANAPAPIYATSGPDAYKLPPWLNQLASQFNLTASTYASGGSLHQMGYAADFDGSKADMDRFADYISQNLSGQTLQLIHADGDKRWGIASGKDVSNSGYYSGDYGGHFDHVHWATDAPVLAPGQIGMMNPQQPMPAYGGSTPPGQSGAQQQPQQQAQLAGYNTSDIAGDLGLPGAKRYQRGDEGIFGLGASLIGSYGGEAGQKFLHPFRNGALGTAGGAAPPAPDPVSPPSTVTSSAATRAPDLEHVGGGQGAARVTNVTHNYQGITTPQQIAPAIMQTHLADTRATVPRST
jgi:hypothetical protein